ncbi:hypothetical protein [Tenacibaculum jejuense]|uniref:Uncharacterized protein n=1 Tax=Tenacibaculum jejuense TaxID=584609 RepID=A0A238U7F1_9FLAO|nr:hypothetical protein [Tenacibaculum jejuense]SNR14310.1 protein of unknown function [Tenacibaculum jejuense]
MKKLLQAILGIFGYKVLTKEEYDALQPVKPIHPTHPSTLLTYKEVVTMLRAYDETRLDQFIGVLGFEDTRINTFEFAELKNYMNYVEKLAKEKGIKLKGISFIKGVYKENVKNDKFIDYENLLYTPTAIINGKETLIDVVNSSKDKLATFKDMLAKYHYEWRYDNKENYKLKTEKDKKIKDTNEIQSRISNDGSDDTLSGISNFGELRPPEH